MIRVWYQLDFKRELIRKFVT